jgi:hypothetical protein
MKRVNIFEDFLKSKWYESVRASVENAYPNFGTNRPDPL